MLPSKDLFLKGINIQEKYVKTLADTLIDQLRDTSITL
jgi:hypothetical protein